MIKICKTIFHKTQENTNTLKVSSCFYTQIWAGTLSRGQKLIKDNIQSTNFSLPECKPIPVIWDPKQKKYCAFAIFSAFFLKEIQG